MVRWADRAVGRHRHRLGVLAAQAMGADLAYIGSAFIATDEARAAEAYKQCIVECSSDDIVYSSLFTGVHGNYLKPSIRNAGMDPDNLPEGDVRRMNFPAAKAVQRQGLEGHLGLRPGHRRGEGRWCRRRELVARLRARVRRGALALRGCRRR